jgi:hypothetical protein
MNRDAMGRPLFDQIAIGAHPCLRQVILQMKKTRRFGVEGGKITVPRAV